MSTFNRLRQGQHVLVVGQNGTGKTTLAQALLSSRSFVVVLDTKGELDWPGFNITSSVDAAMQAPKSGAHTILRPKNMHDVERVMQRAYKAGGWDVAVDEVYMIGRTTLQSFPPHYVRILTAGRSRSVTMWTLTQRPKYLPVFAMTEAKHIFVFELGFEDDRKYLLKNVGVTALDEKVAGHEFLYYSRAEKRLYKTKLKLGA